MKDELRKAFLDKSGRGQHKWVKIRLIADRVVAELWEGPDEDHLSPASMGDFYPDTVAYLAYYNHRDGSPLPEEELTHQKWVVNIKMPAALVAVGHDVTKTTPNIQFFNVPAISVMKVWASPVQPKFARFWLEHKESSDRFLERINKMIKFDYSTGLRSIPRFMLPGVGGEEELLKFYEHHFPEMIEDASLDYLKESARPDNTEADNSE